MSTKNYRLKQETLSKFTRTNTPLDIPRQFTVIDFELDTLEPTTSEDVVVEIEWVDSMGEIQFTVIRVAEFEDQWEPILKSLYDEVPHV